MSIGEWRLAILAGASLAVTAGASAQPPEADAEALRLRSVVHVDSSAWQAFNMASFDQEKIVTFGESQYTIYWDADMSLVVVRRALATDAVQTVTLPYRLTIDPRDGHRNTVVGCSPEDGRLHLSWDHHNNPLRYTRTRAGFLTDPADTLTADDFEPAQPLMPDDGLETRVTYPRFVSSGDGTLYFMYRQGGSGNGDVYIHRYDAGDGTWTRMGTTSLFARHGDYAPWESSRSRNAYMNDVLFDGDDRLHVTWTYREAGRSWASNHDVHYAFSDDGGVTWHNNAGNQVADLSAGDAIEIADPGLVVQPIPVYSWLMNQTTMVLDAKFQPHVITYKMPEPRKPEKLEHGPPAEWIPDLHMFHYWRDTRGSWHASDAIAAMHKRPGVIFDGRENMIIYYASEGSLRCHVAQAADGWGRWSTFDLIIPEVTVVTASKPDRERALRDDVLSFAIVTDEGNGGRGFAIVDLDVTAP